LVNAALPEEVEELWIVIGVVNPTVGWIMDDFEMPLEFIWRDEQTMVIRLSEETLRTARAEISAWLCAGGAGAMPVQVKQEWTEELFSVAHGPWDLIFNLEAQLQADTIFLTDSRPDDYKPLTEHPGVVFIGDEIVWCGREVAIAPQVLIDTTLGAVILDDGVVLDPFTHLVGPAYIGRRTALLGGKFSGGTALGPGCKIAGEWEASIAQGYSNKAHAGFFGHGILGEWVNLGAMTTNSDLKNTYGEVRVVRGGEPVATGQIKVGSYLADHTKTGIGTLIPTGATIGAGVNLFRGGLCPKFVPPFVWAGPDDPVEHRLDRMIETAEAAVTRRAELLAEVGRPDALTENQKELLRHTFAQTEQSRRAFLTGTA
jgi:UDP-N-acetylglucosamine diphosphorylase/glucosamine-1-phosphate N-acetyltransferase